MKVIDLLNKIANGEEIPKKFRFYYITYYLQDNKCFKYCYKNMENELFEKHFVLEDLNREIEIIEDTPKENKKKVKIMNKEIYEITLPNKKKIKLWFKGKELEEILEAYNIPYKKPKRWFK